MTVSAVPVTEEPLTNPIALDDVPKRLVLMKPNACVALAVNASHISDAIGPAQRAIKAAREKLGAGELDAEARKALDAEAEKIGAQVVEIDLTPITEDQLALDKNPGISAATIQALLPIFRK